MSAGDGGVGRNFEPDITWNFSENNLRPKRWH
uniref:Uncharacterized protein n=1 Tax=Peronospora matthiolae TaxID=2874970 RepID=A0AAV1VM13_9STRA